MTNRSIWWTILFLVLVGIVKAQWHFIKLAALGGMGLTGMWMVHKLAQDYTKIRNPKPPAIAKFLFKRSADDLIFSKLHQDFDESSMDENMIVDFGPILRQDPMGCAQRLVCHLSASQPNKLQLHELNILRIIRGRSLAPLAEHARQAFRFAAKLGLESRDYSTCDKTYPKCPYSRQEISKLMQQRQQS